MSQDTTVKQVLQQITTQTANLVRQRSPKQLTDAQRQAELAVLATCVNRLSGIVAMLMGQYNDIAGKPTQPMGPVYFSGHGYLK